MKETSGLGFRLRALLRRHRMERELDEEMQFHLEQETRKQRHAGLAPDDARREALRRFGRISRHKDATRGAWGVRLIDELTTDVRFALRQLAAHRTYSAVAVLTLSLGVGGTVAFFGVAHGLLLRPLPYDAAERLRVFWDEYSWSAAEVDFARQHLAAYRELAAFTVDSQTWSRTDGASMLLTGLLSGDAFEALGTPPLLGRTLDREEERLGTAPVVVLSHRIWQSELGGDPEIVGQRLELDGQMTTVVGVMPEGFFFPTPRVDVWRPLVIDEAHPDYADNHWLVVFGRLHPDVTEEAVRADLDRFVALLGERFEYPEAWDKTRGAFVETMRSYLLGDTRPALLLLLSAVGLLLLMAAANVAALFVARISDRDTELGIRKAMGAGRFRLSRQLVTESLVLGTLASGCGLLLAVVGYRAIVTRLPLPVGFDQTLSLGWPLAAATLVLAPAVSVLVALAPLLGLWRRAGDRGGAGVGDLRSRRVLGPGRGRLQQALVVGELTIAVVLVTCAVLLGRSVVELYRIDPGIEPHGVVALDLFLADGGIEGLSEEEALALTERRRRFFTELVDRLEAEPAIDSATVTNRLPLRDDGVQGPLWPEGRPDLEGTSAPNAKWRYVSPSYFRALGIELVEGRTFDAADRLETTPVGILGRELASRLWPGESAIGKRVRMSFQQDDWIEIVGVAEGVRHADVQQPSDAVLYRPIGQVHPWSAGILVVRSTGDPRTTLARMREQVHRLDPGVAIARPTTMDEVMRAELAEPLRLRFFIGLFSLMALVIGAVGVYGVIATTVVRRTAEYGLRLALGAERRDLVRSVLTGGAKLVGVGVLAGLAAALAASALLSGFLYGVDARDPLSYLLAAALLLGTGVLAATVPAYRASRVDPVTTLQAGG